MGALKAGNCTAFCLIYAHDIYIKWVTVLSWRKVINNSAWTPPGPCAYFMLVHLSNSMHVYWIKCFVIESYFQCTPKSNCVAFYRIRVQYIQDNSRIINSEINIFLCYKAEFSSPGKSTSIHVYTPTFGTYLIFLYCGLCGWFSSIWSYAQPDSHSNLQCIRRGYYVLHFDKMVILNILCSVLMCANKCSG